MTGPSGVPVEAERAKFEEWLLTQGWTAKPAARQNGTYINGSLQARWLGWLGRARAAWNRRAAIPVAPSALPALREMLRLAGVSGGRIMHDSNQHEFVCFRPEAIPAFARALLAAAGAQPLPVAASDADRELTEKALERIEQTLTIPAAEYVPAIGDVFLIIDQTRAALRTRLLRHSEGKAE